ncbi:MAG TPA: acyl-CoA dehydrogenase family protein [Amycolatopsis sp.]|jgi:alkylation response protein AidB-like acyl-CoA dehydrogenase|nr:acyl-CoA dehydrogenase family protein [Amycolatopsis sp.]
MRFTLTQEQIALRAKAAESFRTLPAPWPPYPGDRSLAMPPGDDRQEAEQVGALIDGAWDSEPVAGDDRLLRTVLVAEAAGGSFPATSIVELIILRWLATRSPELAAAMTQHRHLAAFSCAPHAPTARLRRAGGVYQLSGHCQAIRTQAADRVLLPAEHNGRVVLVSARLAGPGVVRTERHPVAAGTSLLRLEFALPRLDPDQVIPLPATMRSLADLNSLGRLLSAAELVGIMQWALDRVVERARTRQQFGRPIGSFQAVAHQCADMLCTVELCRSLVYAAAARHGGSGIPDRRTTAQAWLLLWHDSLAVLTTAVHLFGANGLRWSEPLHLQLRRCQLRRQLWGTAHEVSNYLTEGVASTPQH